MTKALPPNDFRRYWELSRRIAKAPTATLKDYRALGHSMKGARWMVKQDAAEEDKQPIADDAIWGITEVDFQPAQPFSPGEGLNVYEAAMLFAGYEPYAPVFGGESNKDPAHADHRMFLMVKFAEEPAGNLIRGIKNGTIPLVKEAYRHDKPGALEIDFTRCVIRTEAMLDLAIRLGGYGPRISELLALRQASSCAATASDSLGTTATAETEPDRIEQLAEWIYARHSKDPPTFETLYDAAVTEFDRLKKADLLEAYNQRVYSSSPWRRSKTGWPLRSPYKERWEAGNRQQQS
jgi:hypothetical protein